MPASSASRRTTFPGATMSDLTKRLVLQRVKPSGKVYDEVPVEPVGTLTVEGGRYWNDWVSVPHPAALPAGEYLIVRKEAADE